MIAHKPNGSVNLSFSYSFIFSKFWGGSEERNDRISAIIDMVDNEIQ